MTISGVSVGPNAPLPFQRIQNAANSTDNAVFDINAARKAARPTGGGNAVSSGNQGTAAISATVSNPAASMLMRQETSRADVDNIAGVNEGNADIDLDEYFADTPSKKMRLLDTPLLLPSLENIAAVSAHASSRMRRMLSDYGVPSAPASISYNAFGEMRLPSDYPHAAEFKQMLEDHPGLDRELRAVSALSSHYEGMQRAMAFQQEYAAAKSKAELDAILSKYNDLFGANRRTAQIALTFSPDGVLSVTADGKPLNVNG